MSNAPPRRFVRQTFMKCLTRHKSRVRFTGVYGQRWQVESAIAHNKVMVIDGASVITGSFRFTRAA